MLTSGLHRGSELIDTFAETANRSSRRRKLSDPLVLFRYADCVQRVMPEVRTN